MHEEELPEWPEYTIPVGHIGALDEYDQDKEKHFPTGFQVPPQPGETWRSLDPRDRKRKRTVLIERVEGQYAWVLSSLGRRSRVHRSRFDGIQYEQVESQAP